MSTERRNLPILRTQATEAFCGICPDPGHCCRRFYYYKSFWKDEGLKAAQRAVASITPFIVLEWAPETGKDANGRECAYTICSCPKLTPDGKCSIYEERPWACRSFVPGSDSLCVFSSMAGVKFEWPR